MNYNLLLEKFEIFKYHTPNSCQVKCPAHEDKQASLTISNVNDKILLHCHAGCSHHDILAKIGLNESDLFSPETKNNYIENKKSENKTKLKLIATYDYVDEVGFKVHFNNRYLDSDNNKTFKQGHYNSEGKKVFNLKDVKLYLYKLPELLKAIKKFETIYIVEGEKDVENLAKIGLTATTNVGGAGKWKKDYNKYFTLQDVVILQDNDKAGAKHSYEVYENLKAIAKSVNVVLLPDLKEKGDVSDYLESGKTKDDLLNDIKNSIEEQNKKAEKLKKTASDVRNANDKYEEILEAQEYIYEKGKIIFVRVLDMLHKFHNIKTSVIKAKRKYFKYQEGYWKEIDKESLGLFFFDYFDESDKTGRNVTSVINIINSDARFVVDEEKWNSELWKINLNNVTYDLQNYKELPHSPDYYFTYKNDYDFDINADCPIFQKSLLDYSKTRGEADPNWVRRFFEIAGYCLLGTMPFQKMFWLMGNTGRNGKGTVIRILERLVGVHNTVSGVETRDLRDKFKLASFIGKRLASAGDIHTRLANIPLLKSLSGGDKQTTDIKFGDAVSFTNNAKFVFAMNQVPILPENESIKPIAKRIVPLQFNFDITEPDSEIENKFNAEISGIFNYAILGLIDLMRNREFTPVQNADNWLANWANKIPPMQEFLSRYEYEENSKGLFLIDIFQDYKKTMEDFYGSNWLNEPNIYVKGSRKLKEAIIDDIERRYHVIIKSDTEYSTKEGGRATIIRNLRDTLIEYKEEPAF